MGDPQHQDIDVNGAKRPGRAVETQRPGVGNLTPTHYRLRNSLFLLLSTLYGRSLQLSPQVLSLYRGLLHLGVLALWFPFK